MSTARASVAARGVTIRAALAEAAAQLAALRDAPRLEAEMLLAHVLAGTRAQLHTWPERPLNAEQYARFRELVARRAQGEPVAYLIGRHEFWSLDLQVTPDTLIPRPETEFLVELALQKIPRAAAWRIADLGAGCGAIALAVARERPLCHVVATDISQPALEIARANARRLNISNIEFHLGDWFAPLRGACFDVIASNPPYVASGDPHLRDLRFEPRGALVAGMDGLQHLRTIISEARAYLAPQGWLLLEHGHDQAPELLRLLTGSGYSSAQDYPDLAGVPRIAAAQWKIDS